MTPDVRSVTLDDLSIPAPRPGAADWNDDGVVHLAGVLPDDLIAAYQEEWSAAHGFQRLVRAVDRIEEQQQDGDPGGHWTRDPSSDPTDLQVIEADRPGGWPDACPYMRHPALRALCTLPALAGELGALTGEEMGVHLNLTGWVSTQRNWHQDGYLNPGMVADQYAAVWMALGDVHPDSGTFEFVPGSHRWHRLTYEKVAASGIVNVSDPAWPRDTEAVLTPLVEAEIVTRNAEVVSFVPSKGDVLIWHPRLYHRGTAPVIDNAYRPALIAHYSGIYHRPDFPAAAQVAGAIPTDGWFFPIHTDTPV